MISGEILLHSDLDSFGEKISFLPSLYDFCIGIYIDKIDTLDKQLKNKSLFIEKIDAYLDYLSIEDDEDRQDEEEEKNVIMLKNNIDNLMDYVEYVRMDFSDEKIIRMLDENPILISKKIVIPNKININKCNEVALLLKKYDKYKDIIYVNMENNIGHIKLSDCYSTILKIKTIASAIMDLNLSPMETIMYTYDIVRNRVYKEENVNDSYLISRNLNEVLNSDKIVCVGYANIFDSLLHFMGFKCQSVGLNEKNNAEAGHRRNMVYIKDSKYNIDGVYYFDATWDSKRKNQTNEFLNTYKHFAKTRSQFNQMENNTFKDRNCPYYSDDMVNEVRKVLEDENLELLNVKYATSLNYLSYFVYGKELIDKLCLIKEWTTRYNQFDRKKLLKNLKNIQKKFNRPISAETFIKLLNNVRKVQYYQNPSFYPYSVDSLYRVYINSGWNFAENYFSSEEKLLAMIFGSNNAAGDINRSKKDFKGYITEEDVDRNIKGVQLTKVLSEYNKGRR